MEKITAIRDSLMNKEFDSLVNSRQRVDYAFRQIESIDEIRDNARKYLSELKDSNSKSIEKSESYRQTGNQYFTRKNYEYALHFYNLAVMSAPYPSESGLNTDNELMYAFTARSLTLFEMKAYDNSLFDINCCIKLSDILTIKFEDRLQLMAHKVNCLCHLKRWRKSSDLLTQMVQLIPCLPRNNTVVSILLKMREQIVVQLDVKTEEEEDSEEPDKTTEKELKEIEEILKNIDIYRSPRLELCETESKGRHYIACEDIPKGQMIMVEKSTGLLFSTVFTSHCHYCFKNVGYKCWPCPNCSEVVFCNQECSQSAYYHTYECGFTNFLQRLGTNHHIIYRTVLLVGPLKAIDLAKDSSDHNSEFTDDSSLTSDPSDDRKRKFLKFVELVDHKDKYDFKTKSASICRSIQLSLIFDFFDEFRSDSKPFVNHLKELTALLDQFTYKTFVNIFGIFETINGFRPFRGSRIGVSLLTESSYFNHSCYPNTSWLFIGNHISFKTTEKIEKGKEVTISYGPYSKFMAFEDRQSFLSERYFFQCDCPDCSEQV